MGPSLFKRRGPVPQMAGWDFHAFGVFAQPVMGDFVTLTAARGGIEQFYGPVFVT